MASDDTGRKAIARMGGYARAAKAPSSTAVTAAARAAGPGNEEYWYRRTDPELPEADRRRQARAARKAYMTGLSYRAAKKRKEAVTAAAEAQDATAELLAALSDDVAV